MITNSDDDLDSWRKSAPAMREYGILVVDLLSRYELRDKPGPNRCDICDANLEASMFVRKEQHPIMLPKRWWQRRARPSGTFKEVVRCQDCFFVQTGNLLYELHDAVLFGPTRLREHMDVFRTLVTFLFLITVSMASVCLALYAVFNLMQALI